MLPDPCLQPLVMLPQEHVRWLTAQPDTSLSIRNVMNEKFAAGYLLQTREKVGALVVKVIRRDVTRNVGKSQAAVFDEIRANVDAAFGVDETGWRRVCLFEAMETIVSNSTNRMIVGLPLCHNTSYLRSLHIYSTLLATGMLVVGQFVPQLFKSPISFIFRLPLYVYKKRCLNMLVPLVRQVLEGVKQKRANPTASSATPETLLTWIADAVLDSEDLFDTRAEDISDCVIAVVSSMTQSNLVSMKVSI